VTRRLIAVLAIALAAACGGGGKNVASETTAESTSSTTSTTVATTTPPPPPTAPLTGLPIDPALVNRVALVVKIDNGEPKSRPQQGLNQADLVYEEMVEGTVTRFAAVFQSQNAVNRVIPVRSARTTDIALFTPLNYPLYAWSGANRDFKVIIRDAPMIDVGYDAASDLYHRDHDRPAPSNLYTTTEELFSLAPGDSVPPPALFQYRAATEPTPAGAQPVSRVHVSFGGGAGSAPVDWGWDPASGTWLRWQRGTAHVDETGQQIAPRNVVIEFCGYHDTGYVDTSGSVVFEADTVGEGDVWVLTNGVLVVGHWSKPSNEAVTTYTDLAGAPIKLTPGQTWVQLPWQGRADVSVE